MRVFKPVGVLISCINRFQEQCVSVLVCSFEIFASLSLSLSFSLSLSVSSVSSLCLSAPLSSLLTSVTCQVTEISFDRIGAAYIKVDLHSVYYKGLYRRAGMLIQPATEPNCYTALAFFRKHRGQRATIDPKSSTANLRDNCVSRCKGGKSLVNVVLIAT